LGLGFLFQSESDMALAEHGGPFDPYVSVHNPAAAVLSGFVAYRWVWDPGFVEIGVRGYNLLQQAFRDTQAVWRTDDTEMGGELIGRRLFLYLRGGV
jgi:hypothetical protein